MLFCPPPLLKGAGRGGGDGNPHCQAIVTLHPTPPSPTPLWHEGGVCRALLGASPHQTAPLLTWGRATHSAVPLQCYGKQRHSLIKGEGCRTAPGAMPRQLAHLSFLSVLVTLWQPVTSPKLLCCLSSIKHEWLFHFFALLFYSLFFPPH